MVKIHQLNLQQTSHNYDATVAVGWSLRLRSRGPSQPTARRDDVTFWAPQTLQPTFRPGGAGAIVAEDFWMVRNSGAQD